MNEIKLLLDEVLDRRLLELSISKRNILLGKTEEQRRTLFKASVLLIYSSTEGGIKEFTRILFDYINKSDVCLQELYPSYLELAISEECQLRNSINDHDKLISAVCKIRKILFSKVKMPGEINSESNITPKIIRKICKSLNTDYFLTNQNESDLNVLLRYRNNIAHGDRDMPIDFNRIDQFSRISILILSEYHNRILEIILLKKWMVATQADSQNNTFINVDIH